MVFGDGKSNGVTLPSCHDNESWDKMGYNPACARDTCEIFVSIIGVFGFTVDNIRHANLLTYSLS